MAPGWQKRFCSMHGRHYYWRDGTAATQWEFPLNPTVGHDLLLGENKQDIELYMESIKELQKNDLLPVMISLLGHMSKFQLKNWSHHGGCRISGTGAFLDAGNFAYATVWLRIAEGSQYRDFTEVLKHRWPSLEENHMSLNSIEFKGDVIEAMWHKFKRYLVDIPTIRRFRDSLEQASMSARRLYKHVPRETSVVQFVAALALAERAFALPTPRNANGKKKLQIRMEYFSVQLMHCFAHECE